MDDCTSGLVKYICNDPVQESFILSLALPTVKFVQRDLQLRKCFSQLPHLIHIQIKWQHFHCPNYVSRIPANSQKRHEAESCSYIVRWSLTLAKLHTPRGGALHYTKNCTLQQSSAAVNEQREQQYGKEYYIQERYSFLSYIGNLFFL